MKKIYKYELKITDLQTVELPVGAKILTAQLQGDAIQLWVITTPEIDAAELRTIQIFGTGNPMYGYNESFEYISTVQQFGLVWHIFEARS